MKRKIVLIALFILPLTAYVYFSMAKHNSLFLPVLTEKVNELPKGRTLDGKAVMLTGKLTIMGFLGKDIIAKKEAIFNINQKINSKYKGFNDFQIVMLLIGLASVLYGSAQAFTQTNTRLILGYSSVAQLGFITLGIFALGEAAGAQGALLQMVQHGLVVAPLFFIIALLTERTGSEDIREMGGVAFRAPVLATLFLIVALATLAMPGSANFAGEFLILLGLFNSEMVIAIIAFTGVAMASVYMLRMFIRAMHNRLKADSGSYDIGVRDGLVLVPLVLVIIAFAVYPQQALKQSEATVERVVGAPAADAVAQKEVTP